MLPAVGAIPGVGGAGGLSSLTSATKSVTAGIGATETGQASSALPSEGTNPELEGAGATEGANGASSLEQLPGLESTGAGEGGSGAGSSEGGFGEALTGAISSLEATQQKATGAAQQLATGGTSDPEGAVTTVEEAQLAMQLASQIRTKATEALQGVFQTQV